MLRNIIKRFSKEERGATMIEYALIVGLIAVVTIGAINAVQVDLGALFGTIETALDTANN